MILIFVLSYSSERSVHMKKKDSKTFHLLHERSRFKHRLVLEGLLVGLLAGLVAVVYRFMLTYAEEFYFSSIEWLRQHMAFIGLWLIALLLIGWLISVLLKYEPHISGSGIPQVEAEVQGQIDQCWYKVLFSKMLAGMLCIAGGLSLGREGPSIQLGAMTGKAVARFFHRLKTEERFLLTCGAAAGLSAAFNAPLAGILFALEEIHKNFSPNALISVMCASITGDFLSRQIFGFTPSLQLTIEQTLPLHEYGWVFCLGIVTGLAGVLYHFLTLSVLRAYDRLSFLKNHQKVLIPLVLSAFLGLCLPQVMGGGHALTTYLQDPHLLLTTLCLFLLVKFLFSLISFGSGAPGGIFFPMLILGSLIGAIFAKIAIGCGVLDIYYTNFLILAMAGFFAAVVRAPVTGIVLIAEMCGTLQVLLPIAFVSCVGYMVANACHCEPIYESLLRRLTKNQSSHQSVDHKELISFVVSLGSLAVNQDISSLTLPQGCLLVSIVRGQQEMIPHGRTKLYVGDQVIILIDCYHFQETKEQLEKLFVFP